MKKIFSIFAIILPILLWSGSLFANFSQAPDTSGCQAFFIPQMDSQDLLTINFQDLSIANGDITSWDWNFGDGASSTSQHPSHTYATTGEYNVSLTIATSSNCQATVEILLPLQPLDSTCNCPTEFEPVCVQIPGGDIIHFVNECEANCAGFTDFVDCPVDTTDYCQAMLNYSIDDLTVTFQEQSFTTSQVTSWAWDFGDGTTSTEQNPTHVYAQIGDYNVTLSITTESGCSSSTEMPLYFSDCNCATVIDPVCVLDLTGNPIPFPNECEALCAGYTLNDFVDCTPDTTSSCYAGMIFTVNDLTVSFVDASYSATDITAWAWDFGDGATSTEQNPTHEYATQGTYSVSLMITTEGGCSSTYELPIYLTDCNCGTDYDPVCVQDSGFCGNGNIQFNNECEALCAGYTAANFVDCDMDTSAFCKALFGYEVDMTNPLTVNFVDYSYSVGYDFTWAWDFGDGTTSNTQNPTHTYATTGVYSVTLAISSSNGCSSSFDLEVWLEDTTTPCNCTDEYNPVCAIVDSTIFITFWNPCIAECAGFTDFVDCDNTPPVDCSAGFGYYQDITANDLTVQFEDYSYSINPIDSWAWDFGDGTTSTDQNPIHTYTEAGTYTVSLTMTAGNCTESYSMEVYVGDFDFTECQAFFWPFPSDSTNDLTFQFLDLSLGNPTAWAWDFGDGNTSTEQNPTHTFANNGSYTVTLSITSDSCQSSFELVMNSDDYLMVANAASGLQALFTPVMDDITNSVYFKNMSTSSAPMTNVTYDFGDGTKAEASDIQHLFLEKKAYNVTMIVTNSLGETSSFMGTIDLTNKHFTGSTSGTSIVLGNHEIENTTLALQMAPNPVSNQLNITFEAAVAGKYNIAIQTVTGKTIYTNTINGTKGQNKTSVDVQNFPQGIYLLKLQVENTVQTYKFVKE